MCSNLCPDSIVVCFVQLGRQRRNVLCNQPDASPHSRLPQSAVCCHVLAARCYVAAESSRQPVRGSAKRRPRFFLSPVASAKPVNDAHYKVSSPRPSYTESCVLSSADVARPIAITQATMPSIRSPLRFLEGFMFPAASVSCEHTLAFHLSTGWFPCRNLLPMIDASNSLDGTH